MNAARALVAVVVVAASVAAAGCAEAPCPGFRDVALTNGSDVRISFYIVVTDDGIPVLDVTGHLDAGQTMVLGEARHAGTPLMRAEISGAGPVAAAETRWEDCHAHLRLHYDGAALAFRGGAVT